MIGNLLLAGCAVDQTWPYYATVALVGAHLTQQIVRLNIDNPTQCARMFLSNHQVGLLLFGGIVLGTLLREVSTDGQNTAASASSSSAAAMSAAFQPQADNAATLM